PRPTQPWPNQNASPPIQRTQGFEASDRPDQAMFQAPQLPPAPAQQMQPLAAQPATQQPAPTSALPRGYGQPQPAGDGRRTLEQARRDAALMGLGIGPGQPFSSLEQPADRMSPGSMSQLNGAPYAAPPVYSPDLSPIPDLRSNPSFFEQQSMAPPTNSMGQTLPAATSSMVTPGSVNDPNARFQQNFVNPAAAQAPQFPGPPNAWNQGNLQGGLQGYDNARRASDQQLQQSLQNTWAQTPTNFIASPAGGISMPQPAAPAQMMQESWNRRPVAPEPYPQAAPPQAPGRSFEAQYLPSVNPSAGRTPAPAANPYPPAGRPSQPVYRDGVVVPEQYGPGR
ncbi:MAG TPA: hypothetical protein VM510_01200, partial [Caulifigura sp.]|nr:hypothetical protein [Caulifigura sp.]